MQASRVCDAKSFLSSDANVPEVGSNLLLAARAPRSRIARVIPLKYTHPLNQHETCKSAISHSRIIGIHWAPGYCGGNTEARKRVDVIPHFDSPRSPSNKRHATIPINLSSPPPPAIVRDTRSSVSFHLARFEQPSIDHPRKQEDLCDHNTFISSKRRLDLV